MFCCNAAGKMLPPMVVYKSANGVVYSSWGEGGPDGTTYAASKSGWFDMPKFNQWFKQVFIKHIRHLPKEDIKVIIGDNLAAHLSPYVTMLCELHNVRFCFLPENSTHLLQPLDVAVFGPMKRHWRKILSDWKDECMKTGQNSATLPKQVFPTLLKKLMEKDYSEAIRSGFESCGLFPLNPKKGLDKLPKENREVETLVQRQLLEKLSSMRYDQPANKHANRPKKKEKLPAGASYTCVEGMEGEVGMPLNEQEEMEDMAAELSRRRRRRTADADESDNDSSSSSDSDIPLPHPPPGVTSSRG
jgi:hypothetical protein